MIIDFVHRCVWMGWSGDGCLDCVAMEVHVHICGSQRSAGTRACWVSTGPGQEEAALRWISQRLINHVPVPLILLSSCAPTHILSIFSLFFCLAHSILLLLRFLKVGIPLPSDPFVLRSEGGTLGGCSDSKSETEETFARFAAQIRGSRAQFEVSLSKVHLTGKFSEVCDRLCILCVFYSLVIQLPHFWHLFLHPSSFDSRVFIPPAVLPPSLTAVHLWAWIPEIKQY